MKNLTKVLAVVLALAMAFSMVSFAAFTDVAADASYGEAVSVLSALEILKGYEDGTFGGEKTITRAEFAAVICRLLGLGATAEGAKGQTVFTDVPADNWASGYIALAAQQKIVNGIGDNKFAPEQPVKYEEAIKMVVAALGYTPMADTNGGYPGGFQIVAAQKGLLNNVKGGKQGEAATRAIVAQMSYNALEVPLMVQKGFGTQITFETGDQLLLNKLNITKLEGAVEATSDSSDTIKVDEVELRYDYQVTAIDGQSSASRVKPDSDYANPVVEYSTNLNGDFVQTVAIDTTKAVAAEAKALLDYNVVMYVLDADTDDATLVAIAKRGSKNKEVTFNTEDIYTSKTTETKLYVYTDKDADKYESYDLDIDKVYINGRASAIEDIGAINAGDAIDTKAKAEAIFAAYAKEDVVAKIRLLSNQTSGDEYNIAYITKAVDMVVDTITSRTFTIISKAAEKVIIDEENEDARFEIFKDGKKISFADIKVDDVLSIAGYIDGNELMYGTVYVTSTKVSGKITTYDDTEGTVTIDGKDYKLSNDMQEKFVIQGSATSAELKVGDEVTMYANVDGVLVGVDKDQTKTNLKYAYATKLAKSTGISDSYQIRLMTTEGAWDTLDLATKVSVNNGGTSITATNVLWATEIGAIGNSAVANVAGGVNDTYFVNKVIAYEVNSAGDIYKIYFKTTANTDDTFMSRTLTDASYNKSTEAFGGVSVNDATFIFSTNEAVPTTTGMDEDKVSIAKVDALIDREVYANVKAYNIDEDMYAKVLYGEGLVGTIDWASNFFVVSGKSNTTNADGDEGVKLAGVMANAASDLFVSADATVKKVTAYNATDAENSTLADFSYENLAKGDVIIFSKNAKGEADTIYVLADASSIVKATGATPTSSFNANPFGALASIDLAKFSTGTDDYKFIYGYAYSVSSSKLGLAKNATDAAAIYNGTAVANYLSVKSTTNFAYYDQFYSTSGRAAIADIGDITFDKTASGDGDFIFARVSSETTVEDIAIFKAYSTR